MEGSVVSGSVTLPMNEVVLGLIRQTSVREGKGGTLWALYFFLSRNRITFDPSGIRKGDSALTHSLFSVGTKRAPLSKYHKGNFRAHIHTYLLYTLYIYIEYT
jgi:hypothetical protein